MSRCGGAALSRRVVANSARPIRGEFVAHSAAQQLSIFAGGLFSGDDDAIQEQVTLDIDAGCITAVRSGHTAPPGRTVLDLRDYVVLPGLINMHAHLVLPGDGTPFAEWAALPDEILLLKAAQNARTSLQHGVTTLRDCGGRGQLTFRLREAIRRGIVPGPRLVLSGRPLTITGGHCHYFGGEVDGVDALRHAARQVLAEGADFVKLMAAGGGTVGTYPQYPAFETEELRAAIAEAHKVGKPASCHCIATESIRRALEAGTDHIEHCTFLTPDQGIVYDETLAAELAARQTFVTATLQVVIDESPEMETRFATGSDTPADREWRAGARQRLAAQQATIGRLHKAGVPIVAGNDAGWRATGFDDFAQEIALLVDAGLPPAVALHAATGRAADACGLGHCVGRLQPGYVADLIAIPGDPLSSLASLQQPALVMQGGAVVSNHAGIADG